jgi:hypothetical protein
MGEPLDGAITALSAAGLAVLAEGAPEPVVLTALLDAANPASVRARVVELLPNSGNYAVGVVSLADD